MSSIIVRGLGDGVKQQLAAQAKEHGRSIVAEVRDIQTRAARRPHMGMALLSVARDVGGVDELPIPTCDDVASASSSWTRGMRTREASFDRGLRPPRAH